MNLEVWYDERISDAASRLAHLASLGVTGVRLMVNREGIREGNRVRRPSSFQESLKFNERQVVSWIREARSHQLKVRLTLWPQSHDVAHGVALADFVRNVCAQEPVESIELDVEGFGWYKNRKAIDLRRAGDALHEALRICDGIPMMGTTYPGAIGVCAASLPWISTWTLQAYSKTSGGSRAYEWGGRYGPGNMQHYAAQKLKDARSGAALHMGLAAYGQNFARHGVEQAMHEAMSAATQYSDTLCYWSSKWLRPGHRAADVLRSWNNEFINASVSLSIGPHRFA